MDAKSVWRQSIDYAMQEISVLETKIKEAMPTLKMFIDVPEISEPAKQYFESKGFKVTEAHEGNGKMYYQIGWGKY
jgi:hypothetical protein